MLEHLTPGGLRALLADQAPYALLDVREPPEAAAGHLPSSTNLPIGEVELRADTLLPDLDVRIVIVDDGDGDGRASVAAGMLERLDYRQVSVLDGGIRGWQATGGSLERGRNVPSKRFGERILAEDADLLIEPDELDAALSGSRPPVVLDVRTPFEHRREHVPSARNTPGFDVLGAAAEAAAAGHDVVVHCTGRTRGIIAARTLRLAGITGARALHDGTMGWALAGKPLVRGEVASAAPRTELDDRQLAGLRDLATDAGVELLDAATAVQQRSRREDRWCYAFDVQPPAPGQGSGEGFVPVLSGQLIQQLDEWMAIRQVGAVVACDGGERSLLAGYWLSRLGVPHVAVIDGGLPAWRDAGGGWRSTPAEPRALSRPRAKVPTVDPSQAQRWFDLGARCWSVAPSPEYEAMHLPGTHWLPRRRLELDPPTLDGPAVLSCTDGERSLLAAEALFRVEGGAVDHLVVLEGGVAAWEASGRAVVRGRDGLPDDPGDVWRHPLEVGEVAMRDYLSWEIALTSRTDGHA